MEQTKEIKCKTMKVEECAELLGIGRASMYSLVHDALNNNGHPFAVVSLRNKLLVSRKSFYLYLDSLNL